MRYFVALVTILLALGAATPKKYRAVPLRCEGPRALIRTMSLGGHPYGLWVDTRSLRTTLAPVAKLPRARCAPSRYIRLLKRASSAPWPLQNDGITRGRTGLYLTTDLCPSSKKGYERRLYQALIASLPHPVPVTLFVTKRWIDRHPAAFEELKNWDERGALALTWGNHTAWHHYHPGAPLERNFVLSPEENLTGDVLELEKALIARGVTPSVFFRFPGLISDRKAIETVTKLGLITIGADAWLAKGQKPKKGSIILVHGNGNEPSGVDRLLRLLKERKITNFQNLNTLNP